ncbi:hypothetical protein JEQ12_016505 [Ovis aries]|uniref:Uncharacterized protein n=1 Tax=Ovis aries TaxID=9940 RepID=A0A836A5J9_SHEEP|nr:hypothetical protein JEQ12_016505 [Ovis aries]
MGEQPPLVQLSMNNFPSSSFGFSSFAVSLITSSVLFGFASAAFVILEFPDSVFTFRWSLYTERFTQFPACSCGSLGPIRPLLQASKDPSVIFSYHVVLFISKDSPNYMISVGSILFL